MAPFDIPRAFRPDKSKEGPEGGRGLEVYEKFFGFDRRELEGKTVLDLGSGTEEKFSRELKASGVKTDVISMNPDYHDEEYRRRVQALPGWEGKSVAAVGEHLPFKDETFDRVFALFSVTVWAKDPLGHDWSSEICRVLKRGGEARIGPIDRDLDPYDGDYKAQLVDTFIEFLKTLGVDVEIASPGGVREILIIRKPEDVV